MVISQLIKALRDAPQAGNAVDGYQVIVPLSVVAEIIAELEPRERKRTTGAKPK